MKTKELRQLDIAGLRAKAKELREEKFWLSFKARMGQTEKAKNIQQTRRNLARVLTVLTEKEQTASKVTEA